MTPAKSITITNEMLLSPGARIPSCVFQEAEDESVSSAVKAHDGVFTRQPLIFLEARRRVSTLASGANAG